MYLHTVPIVTVILLTFKERKHNFEIGCFLYSVVSLKTSPVRPVIVNKPPTKSAD